MEELIFFAIIIIFSIIDSIARSRKKKQTQETQRTGEPTSSSPSPSSTHAGWEEEDVETYDADLSYDDLQEEYGSAGKTLPGYSQRYGSTSDPSRSSRESAEGMIPADIWEEIAGLATGRAPVERKPGPRAEPEPLPSRSVEIEPVPPRPVQAHRVHRAHAGYGTDPSSRARSELDARDPLAARPSADVRQVRRQLRRGSHALRRAVILQEVLGQPAALKPERFLE
jgi:hypothetical protein